MVKTFTIFLMTAYPFVLYNLLKWVGDPDPLQRLGAMFIVTNGLVYAFGMFAGLYLEQGDKKVDAKKV